MEISVICPVFDTSPPLLQAAVASVLAEGGETELELILVDDASRSSDTVAALDALAANDSRIRLARRCANAGPASARNEGIGLARGEWIGFIDADDLWLPGRIARSRILLDRKDVAWIGGRHRLLHPDGLLHDTPNLPGRVLASPELTRMFIANFWMHLGATLVRRHLVERIGGFSEGLSYYEDFLFLTKLSVLSALHPIDADVYAWRRAGTGLTASPARLAARSMRMHGLAAADPLLRGFRRELRWARYSARKGLALNNLLAGRRGPALALALDAWRMDPREFRDLIVFLGLWARHRTAALAHSRRYSPVEHFQLQDSQ
ncbi:glycosyltransferase involved in cell wall biosynthesis [Humitalea rosea]|uniref:Glycosyltransferase involved in cell wall biosynthesis n=1 Tax=Humitalea rosea TaxID=990373 RepID=A0A2W7IJA7_9PROT|nr:glycosyltransferase family A protein [Humitalea rosea]PZW46778.1 glycosyltransferase involved in cell wall biosynthesis [Humitalea rosea]